MQTESVTKEDDPRPGEGGSLGAPRLYRPSIPALCCCSGGNDPSSRARSTFAPGLPCAKGKKIRKPREGGRSPCQRAIQTVNINQLQGSTRKTEWEEDPGDSDPSTNRRLVCSQLRSRVRPPRCSRGEAAVSSWRVPSSVILCIRTHPLS